jgi:ABC-type dipeptide/oligopeptide/nickel transport system permease subunit
MTGSRRSGPWRRLAASPPALAGGSIVAVLLAFAVLGPLAASHGPLDSDFVRGLAGSGLPVGPGAAFPLGADRLFRDVFVRLAYAGRLSLFIAVAATAISAALGAAVGIVSGWHQGSLLDTALMRAVDAMLAFPFLLLVMAIGAALDRTSTTTVLVTLGATGWLGIARILRAKTMQVRAMAYVEASRALGTPTRRLMLRHVLPNVAGPLVVTATAQVAQMIVADSALSYLGVGIAPPTPTWGRMLYEGQDYYLAAPWLVAAPGLAILLAVWGFNMLGEGLRDALDPRDA